MSRGEETIGLDTGCAVARSVFRQMLLDALRDDLTIAVERCEPYDHPEHGLVRQELVIRFQGEEVASCPS